MRTLFIFMLSISSIFAQQIEFEAQEIDNQVAIGYGLAIGDVDGDGKPDILLADKKQFVWYRNGDWKRFVMAENLTEHDNVCIAARDITGDGKVEVAVGAQWNPGETTDSNQSGSVHYLIRPEDPTQLWEVVTLPHEPTVHRMRWAKAGEAYHLIVLPLHGRGNKMGQGAGVRVQAYIPPKNPKDNWEIKTIDASMHMTHNLDIVPEGDAERILVGGREGVKAFHFSSGLWKPESERMVADLAVGELRMLGSKLATVEPMHGNKVAVYSFDKGNQPRKELDTGLAEGHAIGWITLSGKQGILSGWRVPNAQGDIGIRLYLPDTVDGYAISWIDQNGMATEDMQVADLNGDGKPDIIASGRSTNNLKIYWNRTR